MSHPFWNPGWNRTQVLCESSASLNLSTFYWRTLKAKSKNLLPFLYSLQSCSLSPSWNFLSSKARIHLYIYLRPLFLSSSLALLLINHLPLLGRTLTNLNHFLGISIHTPTNPKSPSQTASLSRAQELSVQLLRGPLHLDMPQSPWIENLQSDSVIFSRMPSPAPHPYALC